MPLRIPIAALLGALLPWSLVGCETVGKVTEGTVGKIKSVGGKRRGNKIAKELEKRGAEPAGTTQVLGGTIKLVRGSMGFVLIQSQGDPPPPSSELSVQRRGHAEPVAQLRMSPEFKTGFVVADILSGEPREGDLVLWSKPDAPPPPPMSVPENEPLPGDMGGLSADDFAPVPTQIDPETMRPVKPGLRRVPSIDTGAPTRRDRSRAVSLDPEGEIEAEIRNRVDAVPEP